ncbi:alpha/beta hydrolase [Legionella maioricensis]|uniref:Alpha/beta hydrolase n=1 Tax=Legionella maioricensis TaxID=2896528 RepID=A0A9X2IC47_9GAMM|nr:alpha/beta hydrolase [Legionella maioricensis]MCL9685085.1 alpha/beta hydrolase [Legionella maioricensis]MCL9688154.1 alpha/beta hydrolase [Legionella maioricensis]
MSYIIRTVLVFFLIISNTIADVLEIKVDQHPLSLPYWPASKAHYGGVIIVRGGADAAQSPRLLTHFAEQLSHNGWSVVLLNCNNDNTIPWVKQIPETISALREAKNKRIVLVHYGEQLNQSLEYFSKPQSKMINGLVMVSAYDEQSNLDRPPSLRFPLFDIAGQFDYDTVLNQMEQREKEFKQHNYVAVEMPGAHHDYQYSQRMLLAFIHGWMTRLPEFEIQPRPILVSYIEPVYSSASLIAKVDESNWVGFIDDPVEPEQ